MQHDNWVEFRAGVLIMLLEGRVNFTARWKDVAEMIAKEAFAKPEEDLGDRPANLFEVGFRLFEERAQKHRDKFKQLIKDAGVAEAVNEMTVDKLISEHEAIATFAKNVQRPVIEALLNDRKRKENKRRLKERQILSLQLECMLRECSDIVFSRCIPMIGRSACDCPIRMHRHILMRTRIPRSIRREARSHPYRWHSRHLSNHRPAMPRRRSLQRKKGENESCLGR